HAGVRAPLRLACPGRNDVRSTTFVFNDLSALIQINHAPVPIVPVHLRFRTGSRGGDNHARPFIVYGNGPLRQKRQRNQKHHQDSHGENDTSFAGKLRGWRIHLRQSAGAGNGCAATSDGRAGRGSCHVVPGRFPSSERGAFPSGSREASSRVSSRIASTARSFGRPAAFLLLIISGRAATRSTDSPNCTDFARFRTPSNDRMPE